MCGNVRIVASGRPNRIGICHCLDCRKHHGALFGASAIFPDGAVTIEGETRDYAGRFFCPCCGSSVFGRTGNEVEVNLGALDAIDQLTPTYDSGLSVVKHGCRHFRWKGGMTATGMCLANGEASIHRPEPSAISAKGKRGFPRAAGRKCTAGFSERLVPVGPG
jgi:hypothetical protein